MKLKKMLAFVSALCMMCAVVPLTENSFPEKTVLSASAYEDVTEGMLTFRKYDNYAEVSKCNNFATKVEIPAEVSGLPVTSIGYAAFQNCSSLKSVAIPDSVTSIDFNAFSNCSALTSVTIPDSVTSIKGSVFYNCSMLTSVNIPDSVTEISSGLFYNCSSLTSIAIHDKITSIGNSAFEKCSALTSIAIPDSVTSIGDSAFSECSALSTVTIPDSVTSIGDNAFSSCSKLASVTLSNNVTRVNAFSHCSSLESIIIPASVTEIGNVSFSYCASLTSITILNPTCTIFSNPYSLSADSGKDASLITIYAEEDSTAQAYAEQYGYHFSILSDTSEPVVAEPVVIEPQPATESAPASEAQLDLSPEAVYQALIAFKETYPEGTSWTNANSYAWHGGIFDIGFGCAGFAFMLSDAAFGTLKAREYQDVNEIRIGDILRINNDTHSVIVLAVTDDVVTIAEGNYNSSIHWGRTFTLSQLSEVMDYALTRYPEEETPAETETVEPEPTETTETTEVNDDIAYMKEHQITLDFNNDSVLNAQDASLLLVYAAEKGAGNVKNLEAFFQNHDLNEKNTLSARAVTQNILEMAEEEEEDDPFYPIIDLPENPDLSPEGVYQAMIAFKEKYPEGTTWTNDYVYDWNGGIYDGGAGCAGFAFMLSDAAFGTLKAREYQDVNEIRIGDILRINNDSHSVIVLDVTDDVVTVAEGNYAASVHWGRTFTLSKLSEVMDFAYTRYPDEENPEETETTEPEPTETTETNDDIAYMKEYQITLDFNDDGVLNAQDASLLLVYAAEKGAGNVKNLEEFFQKHNMN